MSGDEQSTGEFHREPQRALEDEVSTLSEAQLAIWLHVQLNPGSQLYNLTHTIETFDVDQSRWSAAVAFVATQQPAQRTSIRVGDHGEPIQVVSTQPRPRMVEYVDGSGLDESGLNGLVRDASQRPFDLENDPLYRMTLISAGDGRHLMVAQAHHIISDLWSLSAWLDAVARRYRDDTKNRTRSLRVTPGSHAVAEAEWLTTNEASAELEYWLDRVTGLPQPELPHSIIERDPTEPMVAQAPLSAHVSAAATTSLHELAQRCHATLPDLVMAALGTVLASYSSAEDVLIGTLRSRRTAANARTMGMFANEVMLRFQVSSERTFTDLVQHVRDVNEEAANHDRLPLSTVLRALREDSAVHDRAPFDVSFGWQVMGRRAGKSVISALALGIGGVDSEIAGLNFRTRRPLGLIAHAPLTFVGAVFDEQLHITATYQDHLVSASTAQRVLDHLMMALADVASNRECRVGEIPVISDAERDRQQACLSGPAIESTGTILDRFRRAASTNPSRIAVRDHEQALTYADAADELDRIVALLAEAGVTTNDYVAVHLNASALVPVALLAVLQRGAAYVPVDPRYPAARREYMLSDSGAAVVLVDHHDGSLPPSVTQIVVTATPLGGALSLPQAGIAATDDAYLMYTSGSTGRPKGVRQTHRMLTNLIDSLSQRPGFGERDCLLAIASLSFDISVVELLLPIAVGGEVFVADPDVAQDAAAVAALLAESHATVFQATPATWRILIAADWAEPELVVWSQAEELTAPVAHELLDRTQAVWNLYGPTETHDCTVAKVDRGARVSLGRPLANTRLDIVDPSMRSVPNGCRGELLVSGAGLANGYLGRGDLTAERFIDRGGERWYRTGDVVALLDDGTLRFDGRSDHQVKLRGFRIELGEIESALARHATVADAVVIVHDVGPDDRRLAAYVTAAPGAMCHAETLHDYLTGALPAYMVPAAIEVLDTIPRLPNNKTDRSQLPTPSRWARRGGEVIPARTATERALVRIWSEVFGLVEVSIHDNFFDLGGHSLLATQIASRVRMRMGLDVNLRALYDSPTIASMARHLEASPTLADDFVLPDVDRSIPLPLSYSQERMWFLHQLLPEGAGYNMAGALRVRGPLDIDALERAFSKAVVRHEALRTKFVVVDGVPHQIIEDPWDVTIDLIDHSNDDRPKEQRERALAESLEDAANRPFTLDELPLVRLVAHRLSEDEHVLFINMHHIIGDEWTFGILSEEISAIYEAELAGDEFTFDTPAVQHTNYAMWHRNWLDSGVMDTQLEYWRDKLDGVTPIELPSDRPRPRMLSGRGRIVEVDMPAELLTAVKQLAVQMRTSPFVLLLTGFKVLLQRHTGLTDLTVGSPIANRNTLESERVISSLVNGVVMRTELDGCDTFSDAVARVHDTALDAFTHQDMPFEKLVEELKPRRDPSRSPLFQLFFNVLNAPFDAATFAGADVVEERIERGGAQFDLTMTISINRRKIAVDYSVDLFDHERIERLLDQYVELLTACVDHPESPYGAVDLRSTEEVAELANTWGHDASVPFDDSAVLHDLVHAQALRSPGRPAVGGDGMALSYAELDSEANQLANHLIDAGIRPGDVVGIYLERSAWTVVSMLATHRAGAAFVPIDPEFPAERVQYMIEDSGARALLTSTRLHGSLTLPSDLVVTCPESGDHRVADRSLPDVQVNSTDLAWIVYTSGSTGLPKGIEVEHRSAVNLFTAMAEQPGITPDDVVLSVTSASFDPSIQDAYLPLINGAMVYIAPQHCLVDGNALKSLLAATGATQMFATPTTWQMLVEVGWPGSPTFLCQSGGEALPRPLADALLERTGSVWNLYGLTETTIWSSAVQVRPGTGVIPVGPPIANTSFHILDANLQPCPAGVPGELYIGGVGLGRRFRNRPDLDESRFIENPDLVDRHRRLYRTGDMATYDRSGRLLFHGRADDQVKIRGRRVEIAEIELALSEHPDIERAAVKALHQDGGGVRLAAFMVAASEQPPTIALLREHLRRYLPDYMLPMSYTYLESFPLTSNLKIDRKALPEPQVGLVTNDAWEAPTDSLETLIAEIWQRHLPQDRVGRHDDFFELGGHSLLAVRVFADLAEQTGRSYPVAALFRGPTVAELANVVRADWHTTFSSLVEVQPAGTRRPFFSVSPFLITTLSYHMLARHLGDDQPLFVFQPQGVERDDPIHQRIEDMAAHYISEMKVKQPHGPYLLSGHCAGSWVAFEMASQLQSAGEDVDLLVLVDSEPPIHDAPERQRSARSRLKQGIAQVQHFRRDGRLRDALLWQIGLAKEQFLSRWTGGPDQRRAADVRATHRRAHASFRPGKFDGDVLLLRSQESIDLRHNDWHLRWSELITGNLDVAAVPGFHATLMLQDDNTQVMARHMLAAIDAATESAES